MYRPAIVFIGESPPASGRSFFRQDSGLYRAIFQAFQLVDAGVTHEGFLAYFAARGCVLIDLCSTPVDKLAASRRAAERRAGEPLLAQWLQRHQPLAMVTMLHSIRQNVNSAVELAGWDGSRFDLPYPGRWLRHREVFVRELSPILLAHSEPPVLPR